MNSLHLRACCCHIPRASSRTARHSPACRGRTNFGSSPVNPHSRSPESVSQLPGTAPRRSGRPTLSSAESLPLLYRAHLQGYSGWKEQFQPAWEAVIDPGQSETPLRSLLSLQLGLQHHHRAASTCPSCRSPGLPSTALRPPQGTRLPKPSHEPLAGHLGQFISPPAAGGGISVPF